MDIANLSRREKLKLMIAVGALANAHGEDNNTYHFWYHHCHEYDEDGNCVYEPSQAELQEIFKEIFGISYKELYKFM